MKQHRFDSVRKTWCAPIGIAAALMSGAVSQAMAANAVTDWNAFNTELLTLQPSGLYETRIYAIQHAAIHDALNTIRPRYRRYTRCDRIEGESHASAPAAVAQASRDVLAALWATNVWAAPEVQVKIQSMIETRYQSALSVIPAGDAKERGKAIGPRAPARTSRSAPTMGSARRGPRSARSPSTPRERRQAITSSRRPTMRHRSVHWRPRRAGGI